MTREEKHNLRSLIERLEDEESQLLGKTSLLLAALKNPIGISPIQISLLEVQYNIMDAYSNILLLRISDLSRVEGQKMISDEIDTYFNSLPKNKKVYNEVIEPESIEDCVFVWDEKGEYVEQLIINLKDNMIGFANYDVKIELMEKIDDSTT